MEAKLRVVEGPFAGRTIRVPQGKLLIGREKDCQLRLDSDSVSRHHCVLLLDEYALRIRDLGSKNGTYVNGSRIGGESHLEHDDSVSIDQLTFEVDLGGPADEVIIAAADQEPSFSQNALNDTGLIEGDTGQALRADSPTATAPHFFPPPTSADDPAADDDPASPEAAPARRAAALQTAAAVGSKGSAALATSTAAPSPRATPAQSDRKGVAAPAVAPAKKLEQPVADAKANAKPKPVAAGKVARGAKKASGPVVRSKTPLVGAGLIAAVGLLAGGAFLMRGSSREAPYAVPQQYVLFNPKAYGSMLSCEIPQDWKQDVRGGQNIGPIVARFSDGRLSIEICENMSGSGIRETAVAMRQKSESARHDVSLTELIHEHERQPSAKKFKSYREDPNSRAIKTKGFGEGAGSDFTAADGIFGTEVRGCRATVLNPLQEFTVICKCPAATFTEAKPVFEKVIATLNCGIVSEQPPPPQ